MIAIAIMVQCNGSLAWSSMSQDGSVQGLPTSIS